MRKRRNLREDQGQVERTFRSLAPLAALALLFIALPGSASAAHYSLFGTYMDSDELNDGAGLGFRLAFFDQTQLQFTATWYDSFELGLFEGTAEIAPAGGPIPFKIDLIPLELGVAHYFGEDASGFYLGGGMGWLILDSDPLGTTDNELGFYVQAGYQARGFFIEALLRNGDGKIEGVPVVGPERFTSVKYDVNGIAVNLGWRF